MRPQIDTTRFRVSPRGRLALDRHDPADTLPFTSRKDVKGLLEKSGRRLYELTELLSAQTHWALLLVFQAMDGAGKDSAIKHVMRGLDPKSTHVHTFGPPSTEELSHDYLWRCMKALPPRGRIGIFNRSYYEDVLVVRVHPRMLEQQSLPKSRMTPGIWQERFEDIRNVERYLSRNGTVIRKFFLNVSRAEQRRRFLERLHDPSKRWKFSVNDVNERLRWREYMHAYEDALRATSTADAPWYVVPADNKWYTRLAIARVLIETLESLDLRTPQLTHRERREIADARRRLRAKKR